MHVVNLLVVVDVVVFVDVIAACRSHCSCACCSLRHYAPRLLVVQFPYK